MLDTAGNIIIIVGIILGIIIILLLAYTMYFFRFDQKQKKQSVLRNYPLLGRIRYFFENIGPEFRQYWFDSDTEGRPFSREEYQQIVKTGKYKRSEMSFDSKRDFDREGYYVSNAMFPKLQEELKVDEDTIALTQRYLLIKEPLLTGRVEELEEDSSLAYLLDDDDAVVIGPNTEHPFVAKSLVGMSGMSYGSLGKNAVKALSLGLDMAQGTWMNTGEGGLSPYHMEGNVDIIMQIGPAMFGVRTPEGKLELEELKRKSEIEQLKAFELKLGQGAKTRGGHIDAEKVTQEIADIRKVVPFQSIDSPNRFKEFDDVPGMCDFIETIRETTGKPVGIKIVVGNINSVEPLAKYMQETGRGPDFITVDGSEGGTGASYQEMMESIGLPIRSALPILHETLKKYGVRDQVKIIASAKMFTPDRIAIALAMGADLVNVARGFMISVGCIQALKCHTNTCPVGVTTTDPDLEKALVVEEKKHRVANYLITLRQGLFRLAAAAGLETPTKITAEHIMYKDNEGSVHSLQTMMEDIHQKVQ